MQIPPSVVCPVCSKLAIILNFKIFIKQTFFLHSLIIWCCWLSQLVKDILFLAWFNKFSCFRSYYDVKFSGNLPPVFRSISKSHLDEPALPGLRQLDQLDQHPPVAPGLFRLQRVHPGAACHDIRQLGKTSRVTKTNGPAQSAEIFVQNLRALRHWSGRERDQGRHREDRQQGGHRPGPPLPRPRDRGWCGGNGRTGSTLSSRGDQQQV